MARCRFFEGEHDYLQDECDREFCREVLKAARPRLLPLPLRPNPADCNHEWDVYFAKMKVPWAHRSKPGWASSEETCIQRGLLMMSDRTFSICHLCGSVDYLHPELGGPLFCTPLRRAVNEGK